MRKATRARQRVLALFLLITAVLYIGCEAGDTREAPQHRWIGKRSR